MNITDTLRALLTAADPLPWTTERRDHDELDAQRYDSPGACLVMALRECKYHPIADTSANPTCTMASAENAALIAEAVTLLPALLAVYDAAKDVMGSERLTIVDRDPYPTQCADCTEREGHHSHCRLDALNAALATLEKTQR